MTLKKIFNSILLFSFFMSCSSLAAINYIERCHPFYAGIMGGYGSTTWGNLVPKTNNEAMSTSVPIDVTEGGFVWGAFAGYTVLPTFAVELSYMRYPVARLYFDEFSLFSLDNNDRTELTTKTSRIALVGKFLLPIPCTYLKAFSSVGVAEVLRSDALVRRWRLSPTFGAGFDYDLTRQWVAELGTEYVAGYGQSELDPANHYIPFLYSVFLRIAYKF